MEHIFRKLKAYVGNDSNTLQRWSELEGLLQALESKEVSSRKAHLVAFAALQAATHIMSSCFSKAYDLANDLRDKQEKRALKTTATLSKRLSAALKLEITSHRLSQESLAELKQKSSSEIVAWRDWNFFLLRDGESFKMVVFNYLAPQEPLEREISPVEVSIAANQGYYPFCNDIAEEMRFKYWLNNEASCKDAGTEKPSKKSWLHSLIS